MPQMRLALRTGDLGADHAVAGVTVRLHAVTGQRQPEARPTTAGVELRVGAEQLAATADTQIDTALGVGGVLAGERALCALLLRHVVLQRREPLPQRLVLRAQGLHDRAHAAHTSDGCRGHSNCCSPRARSREIDGQTQDYDERAAEVAGARAAGGAHAGAPRTHTTNHSVPRSRRPSCRLELESHSAGASTLCP